MSAVAGSSMSGSSGESKKRKKEGIGSALVTVFGRPLPFLITFFTSLMVRSLPSFQLMSQPSA